MSRRQRHSTSSLSSFLDVMTGFAGVLVLVIVTMLVLSQLSERKVQVQLSDRTRTHHVDVERTLFLEMREDGLQVIERDGSDTRITPWETRATEIVRGAHQGKYTYLLVFLRPGTFVRFRTDIHPRLDRMGIPFGYEPVPSEWQIELALTES